MEPVPVEGIIGLIIAWIICLRIALLFHPLIFCLCSICWTISGIVCYEDQPIVSYTFLFVLICIAGFIYYSKFKKVEFDVNSQIDSANKILEGSIRDFWENCS